MALTRVCLDTSAYSNLKRGHTKLAEVLDRAEWVGISSIVLGELHAGFEAGSHREKNESELEEFLDCPNVETLSVDHDVARIFGNIVVSLRRQGTPLPANDIWIAAACARAGATLLTFDAHFQSITRIGVFMLA
jgi:predicted nucleic acid-binding protein